MGTHRDTMEKRLSFGVLWLQEHPPLPFWETFPFASPFQTAGVRGIGGRSGDS